MVDPIPEPARTKIGARIKLAREEGGFDDFQRLSAITNIPASIIRNIEEGNVSEHFKETYALLCFYNQPIHSVFRGNLIDASGIDITKDFREIPECEKYILESISLHSCIQGKKCSSNVLPLRRGSASKKFSKASSKHCLHEKRKVVNKLTHASIKRRAKETLSKHGLYKLPINVYQLAENLGVTVSFESFPSEFYMKIKGFCYREEDFAIIGVNKAHPSTLQRFTLAHELHHYLYDFSRASFLCGPSNEEKAIELNAEKFAAELLMPDQFVQKLISSPINVRYLTVHLVASHFGVSYEAAAIRLSHFGLVASPKDACKSGYRRKDKQKTELLLETQKDYLAAVFGLETGIESLQDDREVVLHHSACRAPIIDRNHAVCWKCGLDLEASDKNYERNPYRQDPSNINDSKILSLQSQKEDYGQLSLNLDVN